CPRRYQRVAAAQPPPALAERDPRAFAARAHLPVALAALRARPRLGAPAPCPARLRRAPLAARGAGFGPPAGESDHRFARAAAAHGGRAAQARKAARRRSTLTAM